MAFPVHPRRSGTGLQAQLAAYSNSNFTTKDVVRFITIRR
jgi:hypothetical protein